MAGGTSIEYVVRVQEPGAESGWLPMPGVRMLSTAENKAELFHRGGFTVEIDEVKTSMIRRWHNPKPKTKPREGYQWVWDPQSSEWLLEAEQHS